MYRGYLQVLYCMIQSGSVLAQVTCVLLPVIVKRLKKQTLQSIIPPSII